MIYCNTYLKGEKGAPGKPGSDGSQVLNKNLTKHI